MPDFQNPLTEEHRKQLKENLAQLDKVDALIAQAERGGIDVSGAKQQAKDQRLQITKLLQAFFPGL